MKKIITNILTFICVCGATVNAQITGNDYAVEMSYRDENPFREALKPVPGSAVFKMEGYFLWDPSLIEVDGTYHLFMSRWPLEKGFSGWMASNIIRATSKSLYGPYTFQEEVLSPVNHPWATKGICNSKIVKIGNQYLLYYLGIPKWQCGFAFSDKIEGPWKSITEPVIPTNNPALMQKEDGKIYVVGKYRDGVVKDGKWDVYMNAFEADCIMGPYRKIGGETSRLPRNFELEDPTLWWANNQYNVICTDYEGKVSGLSKSVLMYTSKDGVNYKLYSNVPIWKKTEGLPMENGKVISIELVERPEVYINEQGEIQSLLVSIKEGEESYIVIRPVDNFIPKNK